MTKYRSVEPAKPRVGTGQLPYAQRWFNRQLEISFGQPKNKSKPKPLIIPWFSKELEIRFFTDFKPRKTRRRGHKTLIIPLGSRQLELHLFGLSRSLARTPSPRRLTVPIPAPQGIAALALILFGLWGAYNFGLTSAQPEIPGPNANTNAPQAPLVEFQEVGLSRAAPKQLRIPAIGVNSPFVELDKAADGTIQVPERYDIVGWYKRAPTPGEVGPAIILGHVDNYQGPAVFYRLGQLKPGDIIEVDRADNISLKFRVDQVKQFPIDNFPTQEVYGNIDHVGLRLITCSGQFNRASLSYTHNTVVFASLVP